MPAFPKRQPVVLRFPEEDARQDCWGRLERVSGTDAVLTTRARLSRGDRVLLDFELGPESFQGVAAAVHDAQADADGYTEAELRLTDEVQKRKLAAALLDILSR